MTRTPPPPAGPSGRAPLDARWQRVRRSFRTWQDASPAERPALLDDLFQELVPILEDAAGAVALRHFLLFPAETAVARLFALAVRRDRLPTSRLVFQLWVESSLLRALADPGDPLGATDGKPEEASGPLQQRFNGLPQEQRMLLYLYLVEGCTLLELANGIGLPAGLVRGEIALAWGRLRAGERLPLPASWGAQERLLADRVAEA